MDFLKPQITVKEQQQCCVNGGIKKSGLIKRLENYEREKISQPKITNSATKQESQLTEISIDTESIVSSQTITTNASENIKERKARITKTWIFRQQYDSHLDYQIEDCWKFQQSN